MRPLDSTPGWPAARRYLPRRLLSGTLRLQISAAPHPFPTSVSQGTARLPLPQQARCQPQDWAAPLPAVPPGPFPPFPPREDQRVPGTGGTSPRATLTHGTDTRKGRDTSQRKLTGGPPPLTPVTPRANGPKPQATRTPPPLPANTSKLSPRPDSQRTRRAVLTVFSGARHAGLLRGAWENCTGTGERGGEERVSTECLSPGTVPGEGGR